MTSPLLQLELTFWHPSTRFDGALMDATFAPDFHEFGRSGSRYARAEMLPDPADARPLTATLHGFISRGLE